MCVRKAKYPRPSAQGLGPTCDGEGTCSTHVPLGLMDPVRARAVLEMVPRKSAEEVQRTLAKAHHIDICGCATRAQGDVNTSPFVCSLTPNSIPTLRCITLSLPNASRCKRVHAYTRTHAQSVAYTRDTYHMHTALNAQPVRPE